MINYLWIYLLQLSLHSDPDLTFLYNKLEFIVSYDIRYSLMRECESGERGSSRCGAE